VPHNFAHQAADFHTSHLIDHSIKKYGHISIRRIGYNSNGDGRDIVVVSRGKYSKTFHIHGVRKGRKLRFFLSGANHGVARKKHLRTKSAIDSSGADQRPRTPHRFCSSNLLHGLGR